MTSPSVCVVLHDCAPARASGCEQVLRALRGVARRAGVALPLTLLVVPRWHGQPGTDADWTRRLQALAAEGHELALHGLTHQDAGPPARSPLQWLIRRHYTASEGEFAALDQDGAARRLSEGLAWAHDQRLPMKGFVAPAWLLSAPAWRAVARAGFSHTCTLSRIVALPGGQSIASPSIVYSTRAPWRRAASLVWNAARVRGLRHAPLLRLDLHPDDAEHEAIREAWTGWLLEALRTRRPLRLSEAASLAAHSGTPSARSPA